nr:hypothetical protein [Tanacetum cinerariifolium]
PSPTHGIPFTDITLSTQSSPAASSVLHHRVMILAPGQPIPHGRSYRYHPNGPIHMMTARKRVGPLPTHRHTVRHSVDYSSLDHFTLDDSSRDSSSSSSSKTSSDSPSDDLSDSSSSHSSSDHSLPELPSGTRSNYHLCLLVSSISRSSAAERRPYSSVACPSRKRNLEYRLDESSESSVTRETNLKDDVVIKGSDEPHLEHDINLEIQAEIDECIAYADALKARGVDARVVVEAVDREEIETGTRGPIEGKVERVMHPVILDDITEPTQEAGVVEVTYETLGDQVQRFHDYTEEILVHRVQAIKGV